MRLSNDNQRKYRKMIQDKACAIYGKGGNSAWDHMSGQQRQDALLAQAAIVILMQANSVAESLTLADAQEIILLAYPEEED